MNETGPHWRRDAAVFLGSQLVSLFGSSLVQYAIMWHITLETRSGAMMTTSIVCGFVPVFLLSPFAGVWADRFDRKKLVMLADGAIALATLIAALIFMAGYERIWLLFLVQAVRAAGSAFHGPAVGALLSLTSIKLIFFIDVATAAVAIAILLVFLQIPPHAKARQKQTISYFHDMRLGFRYIKEHRYLISMFIYVAFMYIFISPAAFLTPLQTTRSFGDDVWRRHPPSSIPCPRSCSKNRWRAITWAASTASSACCPPR